jgi:hypothetical protein
LVISPGIISVHSIDGVPDRRSRMRGVTCSPAQSRMVRDMSSSSR